MESAMPHADKGWYEYESNISRGKRLLRMFVLKRNAEMTAKDAADEFGDIERGCITVFCKRWDIPLPRTTKGRKFYARCRKHGIIPRVRRKHPRKY
jgi:hypothetical protein